jgi:hypothetical protein
MRAARPDGPAPLLSITMPTRTGPRCSSVPLGWNHRPGLALVDNLNRAIKLATGEWIHQLHDDYLSPNAGAAILDAIHRAGPEDGRVSMRSPREQS